MHGSQMHKGSRHNLYSPIKSNLFKTNFDIVYVCNVSETRYQEKTTIFLRLQIKQAEETF